MKIQTLSLTPYENPLNNNLVRSGLLLKITDDNQNTAWGDVAPLPNWSKETEHDTIKNLNEKKEKILKVNWTARDCLNELQKLNLLPALSFGLESALLSLLKPLPPFTVASSALLMGSPFEILEQAKKCEGYTTAKLKVGNLTFDEAASLIDRLKNKFRLRIDVNRAWKTADSIVFFSQYPLDTFDYVEEPFQNPHDLAHFNHPLAVDESFPDDLSLKDLESLPTLKALIYKPTIQGGMLGCIPLCEWAESKRVQIVVSSAFESDIGVAHVASIAHRLSLTSPAGLGTYHFLKDTISIYPLQFSPSQAAIPSQIIPNQRVAK